MTCGCGENKTRMMALLSAVAGLPLSILLALAQAPSAVKPAFDVVSIKPNKASDCVQFLCGVTTLPKSGRLIVQYYSLLSLVRTAYGVRVDDIVGGPTWRDDDKFDVEGKAEGAVSDDQTLYLMLQGLLTDRFKLAVHHETKEVPVYALVLGKNGPKLQKAAEIGPPTTGPRGGSGGRGGPGVGSLQLTRTEDTRQITGRATMPEFATFLSRISGRSLIESGRPVLNETDLAGVFDIKLEWIPEPTFPGELDPGLISAIQSKLDLKFEDRKGTGEVLVIDHAEKPSEN